MNSTDPNAPSDGLPTPDHPSSGVQVPVVGVGASAGGIEAITTLLSSLPSSPGLILLLVQHLSPNHESHLPEIYGKITQMPVQEARHGMKVEPNHVYIIPPDRVMTIEDGHLALGPRGPRGLNMPIDHLFRSLARVHKSHSVGVILSGEGTDGTLGFKDIKAEGGITFAQDEKSARHDSMPRAAIADGCVDYVLAPEQIARELVRLTQHPYASTLIEEGPVPAPVSDPINQIIVALRAGTSVDFTHYKRTTIRRRVQRRMALRNVEKMEEYLAILKEEPPELHALYQDFLIRVTQFFRDPEAFEVLKERVFPQFLQDRPAGHPIRIWVSGCATGEEVYSLAIALLEFLNGRTNAPPIKILATDLNDTALERARAGVFVDNIEIDVSPERLRRFFVRAEGQYHISKTVRELCVFSRHNMGVDPPFSHLDLISCRNVLIYMDAALQRRVLPVLHYALRPGGVLFLGSSESIGPFTDLFTPVDAKHRIFTKRAAVTHLPLELGPYTLPEGVTRRPGREEAGPLWNALDVQREADRIVLSRYAPVGVVIDEAMTVLQFRGKTGLYLEPAPGMASLDLLRMLREGLLSEVRAAVTQAKAENIVTTRDGVRVVDNGHVHQVRVEVIPFKVPPAGVRFFLVLFQEAGQPVATPRAVAEPSPPAEQQTLQLQQELAALREYLQSVIEEQESTNEELKSANEEILSANEELQSTNEELQTAKEEAQSANEELATVNEELRHRNAEMARVNNDLVNLLSGVNIPIVMVSRDLRVRRFTPVAEKVFNLIPTDTGRPISDIKPNLQVDDLSRLIAQVIDSLTPHESEVQDQAGHWYTLRVRPYVTMENKIDGASVVLLDIDTIKRALLASAKRTE